MDFLKKMNKPSFVIPQLSGGLLFMSGVRYRFYFRASAFDLKQFPFLQCHDRKMSGRKILGVLTE